MEPMVVFALGIVVYFGYLTVRDILNDLQREGILGGVLAHKKGTEIFSKGIAANRRRLRHVGGLIGADFGREFRIAGAQPVGKMRILNYT
jgi:hypothetical protein